MPAPIPVSIRVVSSALFRAGGTIDMDGEAVGDAEDVAELLLEELLAELEDELLAVDEAEAVAEADDELLAVDEAVADLLRYL